MRRIILSKVQVKTTTTKLLYIGQNGLFLTSRKHHVESGTYAERPSGSSLVGLVPFLSVAMSFSISPFSAAFMRRSSYFPHSVL